MEATDGALLATFALNRNEDAFRELVRRHLRMVFATARRLLDDSHQAEEIAQTVFQLLAEKAGTIGDNQPLAGWLYHTTRHHTLHRVRSEGRRRQREQLAAAMNMPPDSSPPDDELVHELEDALTELEADERNALVLRFFEDRQLRDVGRELGVSEEAARKRVTRALDRLREVFGRKGITASTGAITAVLVGQASIGVPSSLGAAITATVLSGAGVAVAAATASTLFTQTTTMNLLNLKAAVAVVAAAAVTGTSTYLVKQREATRLRADYQTLNESQAKLADEQKRAQAAIQIRDDQIEQLKKELAELPRLRGEVDRLNRQLAEMTALRKQNEELKDSIAKARAQFQERQAQAAESALEKQREAEKQAGIRRLDDMRNLGLAIIMHVDANGGWFPDANEFAGMLRGGKVTLSGLSADNIALVFQGRVQDIAETAKTIVAQQIDYSTTSDSQKIYRAYGFADGHSEIHSASDLQQMTAWENRHIIPPELQTRRP